MSEKENGGREYTVDEILKEYESKDISDNEDTDIADVNISEDIEETDELGDDDFIPDDESEWAPTAEEIAEAADESLLAEELEEEEALPEESGSFDEEVSEIFDDMPETDVTSETALTDEDISKPEDMPETKEVSEEEHISETETAPKAEDNDKSQPKKSFWSGLFPVKGDSVPEIIRKVIFLVASCVFVGAGVMLVSTLVQSQQSVADSEKIKEQVTTTVATSIDNDGNVVTIAPTEEEIIEHNFDVIEYYKEINEDVRGFVEIEGCDLYQPVAQGEDNDYYLTHTYYKGSNKAGAIFMDYRCIVEEDYMSPNIVLYGHNQEDGTMFGNLDYYKQDLGFYARNPAVTFNTEYGVGTYLIYGYFVTNALPEQDSNGEVFRYHDYIETMNDENTFNWYIQQVQERNYIVSPVDVQYGDQLLCLSTCSDEFSNSRFVVFARKLRDGEKVTDYDFSETYFNPYAKGVDWEAIMSAETTTEETDETEETEETEETTESEETSETEETTIPERTTIDWLTERTRKTWRTRKPTSPTTTEQMPEETEIVYIFVTDESGNAVTDENGETLTEISGYPVTDESGNVVTDENGETLTEISGYPVTDENGVTVTDENGAVVTSVPVSEIPDEETTETAGADR